MNHRWINRPAWLGAVVAAGLGACSAKSLDNATGPGGGAPGDPGVDGSVTADGAACVAATGFAESAASSSAITLTWSGGSGVTAMIERKSYCGSDDYVQIGTTAAGVATYADATVQASWAYWYRLTTTDAAGTTAVLATSAAASASGAASCGGGAMPQDSEAPATCDSGSGSAGGSGSGSGAPGSGSGTPITDITPGAQVVHPGDDITSIVQACSAHIVHFSAGTYNLTNEIQVPSNCQLEGELGWTSIITGGAGGSNPIFQLNRSSNVTVTRLNFQHVTSQAVSNNNGSGTGNIENLHIYLNLFDHFGTAPPIWLWDPGNTVVERNAFNDLDGDGMHFFSSSPGGYTDFPSSNVTVRWNFGSNLSEVPGGYSGAGGGFIEIQIGALGLHVYQNVIFSQKSWAGMAMSIASGNTPCTPGNVCSAPDNGVNGIFIDGNIVLDNGVPALKSGDPWGAVEIMGTNPIVQNNFIRGWGSDFFYDWIFAYDRAANKYSSNASSGTFVGAGTITFSNNTACASLVGSVQGMIDNPEAGSKSVPIVYSSDTFAASCSAIAPPALYPQIVAAPEILDANGGTDAVTNSVIPGPNTYWAHVNANLNSTF